MAPRSSTTALTTTLTTLTALSLAVGLAACKRAEEPQPDYLRTQREAMERARQVDKTMQKAVDQEGKRADEEGK